MEDHNSESEYTFTIMGWIFIALTIISTITLFGCLIYLGVHDKQPNNGNIENASMLALLSIVGILVGYISAPFCIKCTKCTKSLSQLIRELINVMERF